MSEHHYDYQRVAEAIEYLGQHFKQQPDLNEVAAQVHLSPQHFQRIFTEWAGVSPKKFMQFLSLEHLRTHIYDTKNLQEAADLVGFSAQSRVYDLFINIEGVSPHSYKTFGEGLSIEYGIHATPFGDCLLARTEKGICTLSFIDAHNRQQEIDRFTNTWRSARLVLNQTGTKMLAQQVFDRSVAGKFHLWVQGSSFQLKVWEALLKIPPGSVTTYQQIAESIGHPGAVRAVGTAIGQNPVGYLIPCHRVIRKTGLIGEYHWGNTRKKAILGFEMATSIRNENFI